MPVFKRRFLIGVVFLVLALECSVVDLHYSWHMSSRRMENTLMPLFVLSSIVLLVVLLFTRTRLGRLGGTARAIFHGLFVAICVGHFPIAPMDEVIMAPAWMGGISVVINLSEITDMMLSNPIGILLPFFAGLFLSLAYSQLYNRKLNKPVWQC